MGFLANFIDYTIRVRSLIVELM